MITSMVVGEKRDPFRARRRLRSLLIVRKWPNRDPAANEPTAYELR